MKSYLISYKTHRGGDLTLVEVPSTFRLICWLARHVSSCRVLIIQRMEE